MALTIAPTSTPGFETSQPGDGRIRVSTVKWALSGTYATGGHSYVGAEGSLFLGLRVVMFLEFPSNFRNGTALIVPQWDQTNKKVMFFWGDNANVASAALIEVTNATSLASYAGFVRAYGF